MFYFLFAYLESPALCCYRSGYRWKSCAILIQSVSVT